MFNKVLLIGNLTKDLELRYTPQGTAVCNLRLASNRRWKDKGGGSKEEVLFITVIVWGKRAENCAEYLKKGSHIFVEGRLQSRSWEKDGVKQYTIEVVAENIQFLDRAKEGTSPEETENEQ